MSKLSVKALIWAVCFFLVISGAESQEESREFQKDAALEPFILGELKVEVLGWTSEDALKRRLGFRSGREFASKMELDGYIQDLKQQIENIRSIASYTLDTVEESASPGKLNLVLRVQDSWNIVALPYAKYDTNTGLTASIRGRDYNFLGSLEPFRLNLDFRRDENERISYLLDTEFQFPLFFPDWTLDWYFYQAADIRLDNPWGWTGETRLSAGLEMAPGITGTLTASETVKINQLEEGTIPHEYRFVHGLSLETGVTLAEDWWGLKSLVYSPKVFTEAHNSPSQPEQRPFLEAYGGFSHALSAGRIDWKGNLRSGERLSLSQKFSYRMLDRIWDQESLLEFQVHRPYSLDWWRLGLSARAGAWYTAAGSKTGAGSLLRGIVDRRIFSWQGAYLNLEMPLTVFLWKPAQWWGWDWAAFSGFEMMAGPLLDLAAADVREAGWGAEDLWAGGGLEVLVFSDFIRSFFVRASLAYDLQAVLANKSLSGSSPRDGEEIREISLGLGFFY